jgi:hypothetical protein
MVKYLQHMQWKCANDSSRKTISYMKKPLTSSFFNDMGMPGTKCLLSDYSGDIHGTANIPVVLSGNGFGLNLQSKESCGKVLYFSGPGKKSLSMKYSLVDDVNILSNKNCRNIFLSALEIFVECKLLKFHNLQAAFTCIHT